jgi:hypothetical protein
MFPCWHDVQVTGAKDTSTTKFTVKLARRQCALFSCHNVGTHTVSDRHIKQFIMLPPRDST